jgi:hypothetical protein
MSHVTLWVVAFICNFLTAWGSIYLATVLLHHAI